MLAKCFSAAGPCKDRQAFTPMLFVSQDYATLRIKWHFDLYMSKKAQDVTLRNSHLNRISFSNLLPWFSLLRSEQKGS